MSNQIGNERQWDVSDQVFWVANNGLIIQGYVLSVQGCELVVQARRGKKSVTIRTSDAYPSVRELNAMNREGAGR